MKDKNTQAWVPMYVDKWLFGSTRLELDPGERSVFVDLIMMGAKDNGYIRANETIAYPPKQLAAFLNVSEELLLSTISKCLQYRKLEEVSTGMWRITSWDKFQLSKSYKSELLSGKKEIPGSQRTESSPQRTKSSPIKENKREEDNRGGRTAPTPSIEEVREYCKTAQLGINPDKFYNYYASIGWKKGPHIIVDWKAAVKEWQSTEHTKPQDMPKPSNKASFDQQEQYNKITDLKEAWHDNHTNGNKCSFCGEKLEFMTICYCEAYTKEFSKYCETIGG